MIQVVTYVRTQATAFWVMLVESTAVEIHLRLLSFFSGRGIPVTFCQVMLLSRAGGEQNTCNAELGQEEQEENDHVLRTVSLVSPLSILGPKFGMQLTKKSITWWCLAVPSKPSNESKKRKVPQPTRPPMRDLSVIWPMVFK